jgi:hypothetical protein
MCLEMQQSLGNKGHLSLVTSFTSSTSSGNMKLHLSQKHGVETRNEDHNVKILNYLKKYDGESGSAKTATGTSQHETNRDIALWFCRDLIPFHAVEKEGFRGFFATILPSISIPSRQTLSSTALDDIYNAVKIAVKSKLENTVSLCLMFDGWTDRYKRRPYMGVRASIIDDDWKFIVVTLGCHIVPTHTGRAVSDHVHLLLADFLPDPKKIRITSCHDGAANMVKASQFLQVHSFQHCSAHCLHLLLTTDSVHRNEEAVEIIGKCRQIVSALHFKTLVMEDETASQQDKAVIDNLREKMARVNDALDLDGQIVPLSAAEGDSEEEADASDVGLGIHKHQSLKAACPTRWNSTLDMLESIEELKVQVHNALKQIGRRDLCLHQDELDFVAEMVKFLKTFRDLTHSFSSSAPTLSIIPMMKAKIRKLCVVGVGDSQNLKQIKADVLAKLDNRFPVNDNLKLQQILDPETKGLIARSEAVSILESAVANAIENNWIIAMPSAAGSRAVTGTRNSGRFRVGSGTRTRPEFKIGPGRVRVPVPGLEKNFGYGYGLI